MQTVNPSKKRQDILKMMGKAEQRWKNQWNAYRERGRGGSRASQFPWRNKADRCSNNPVAGNRWRERVHPIKEVTHSRIESHQPLRYWENATLRRSGRTRSHETRPCCLRFSQRARIAIARLSVERATRVCIRCIVRSPLSVSISPYCQHLSIFLLATVWTILRSDTNGDLRSLKHLRHLKSLKAKLALTEYFLWNLFSQLTYIIGFYVLLMLLIVAVTTNFHDSLNILFVSLFLIYRFYDRVMKF